MERLTQTSDKGGVAFTFDLDITCKPSEAQKILRLADKLKQYEDLGTVEELQQAKEKQTAKKPSYEGDGYYNSELVLDTWICPNCNKSYEVDYDDYDYCPNCGQHIDRSDLE